jgi:hypothetical protein
MLALAYLLQTSSKWVEACLTLKTVVDAEEERDEATKRLQGFIERGRLAAELEVLVDPSGHVFDIIRQSSQQASIVFIGMRAPEEDETPEAYSKYYQNLLAYTDGLPPTAIVFAVEDIEFPRIFR